MVVMTNIPTTLSKRSTDSERQQTIVETTISIYKAAASKHQDGSDVDVQEAAEIYQVREIEKKGDVAILAGKRQ